MSEEVEKNEPSVPSTYYGINLRLSEGLKRPDGVPLYCTSIQEVQAVMKTNKTARFKSFGTQEEAEAFSRLAADPPPDGPASTPAAPSPITCGPSSVGGEKPSPFKNPTRTDFQSFRQLVESGDERGVVAAVARNPRYLVSSGDTPALLREGPRQNSLHLAALRGRHAVCRALLRLAGDPALFQKLYPDDAPEVAAGRADYMSDLYLNMPTKGAFETPLHLAAKMGHLETVRVLVQHPACKRDLTNKFGDTPEQVSCQQYSASDRESVRRQIGFLLQEPFYVQVLAEADGSGAPVLAPPCSPQQQRGRPWSGTTGTPGTPQTPPMSPELTASPLGSPLRPRAWAGPMPRQLADEFHKRWRSPLSVSPLKSRSPARCEDVRLTDAGKGWERVGRELASEMSVEWREFWPFLGRHLDLASEEGLQALEEHLHRQTCRLMDTTANLEEVARRLSPSTPPQRPTPRSPPGHPRPSPLSPVSALCRDLHELRLEDRTVEEEAAEVAPPLPATATVAPRRGRLRELLRRQCSEPLPRELDSDNSDVEEEFYTPPSSVESGSPATPGQAPEVFIHGRHPTADDLDALRALESAKVDRARYPAVCNWRSQVVTRSRTQGFKRVPRAASPPPPPAATPAAAATPSPRRRSPRVSPVWALIGGTSSNRAPNPRPFTTPRRPTCRPPAVPEGDGSPLARPAASRLPLLRHTPRVNGHL